MGNCLRHQSSMPWGGDDWGPASPDRFSSSNSTKHERQEKGMVKTEEEVLLSDHHHKGLLTSSTTSSTEIKIKITKKQLQELLDRVDMKELSVQEVLAQLLDVGDRYETHPRSWRPNLQSIPE